MQEIIRFLMNNVDVLTKVKEGKASLVGVSAEEQQAILDVFSNEEQGQKKYFWV